MNDTSFGINNEGGLVFSYYHEDSDQLDGANVYNGQLSTLWINFRQAFADEIQETYQNLRSNSILNYDELINQFIIQGSDKWSESIYNEDQDFKYVSMLRSDNDATNLPQVRGTGEEHFRYFVENRLNYCDSKWYAGDYPEDNAIVRIYTPVDAEGVPRTDLVIPANADITVTPYSAMYAGVRYKANGTLYQERLEENETYTFEAPNEIFNDTETAIYGASQLSSLGDLAPLYLGYIDVGAATKLVELKIGDGTPGYLNSNLYHLAVGTNRLLKKIDIQNCAGPKFSQALVLSGCPNIEEVYAKGSSITGVDLPESGYLKILQLPATIANLTLKNQPYLADLTIEGLTNLKTMTIENTPVDTLSILSGATNVERVRLTNVDWHHEDASILYELINRDIGGIDENGVNTDTMWIDGKCHIEELTGNELLEIKTLYPYLDITYTTLESQLIYMSEDGQTELTRKTIYNGGNDTCPVESGVIDTPTKESTAQYDYEFNGWSLTPGGQADDNALIKIEADRRVYASFKNVLRNYTVKFMNGSKEETSKVVAYGTDAAPCGKNLFNSAMFTVDNVGHGSSGTLILSAYIPFSDGMLDKACMNLAVGETYVWSGNNLNDILFGNQTLKPNRPFVLTQEMLESNRLGFYALNTTNATTPYTITNIQLELGETPTTFEVYNTIVPVNNSTGNTSDFEFTGWKPEPVDITGDTVCYAQYYDNREITDDWTTIEAACLDGTATEKYPIGSYKPVTIMYDKLPYDFYDGNAVVYKDEIHIMGGVDGAKNHYKFNGEEWVEVGSLPYDLYWGAATIYQDEIHILGSYASGQGKKHYKYNDTDGWTEVSTLPVFFNRGSVVVYNDELHMIGGLGNATHYKYNPTDGWVLISSIDVFYDGGAVVLDNKIHIFGGSTVKGHRAYDGTEWTVLDDLPYSMIRGQAIIYNNEAHILGSDYSSGDSISHYILNASGNFTRTYDLPYYCARFATVIYNDKIHILGSYNTNQRKSHYLLDSGEWIPNGDYETINMEVIAHNHDELTDGVNKWESVGILPDSSYMNAAVVLNNEVYILNSNKKLYKYDGVSYTHLANLEVAPIRETVVVYNNEIHFLKDTTHYKWNGTELVTVSTLPVDATGSTVCVYNNEMYWFGNNNASLRTMLYVWSDSEQQWTSRDNTLSNYSSFAIVYNDKLHVFYNYEHRIYDGNSWTVVANAPFNTIGAGSIIFDGDIYLCGGQQSTKSFYRFDGESWTDMGSLPYKFSNGSALVYNNEIHIFGGDGVSNRTKHWKWAGAEWVNLTTNFTTHPSGFYGTNSIVFNDKIYTFYSGGILAVFDFDAMTMTDVKGLDVGAINNFAVYNSELHMIVKKTGASNNAVDMALHYKYNADDGTFSEVATLPTGVYFYYCYLVSYKDCLYLFNGFTQKTYYKYDGTGWTIVGETPQQLYTLSCGCIEYDGVLYAVMKHNMFYKYDGVEWTYVCSTPENFIKGNMIVYNNDLLYIGGASPSARKSYKFNGTEWIDAGIDIPFNVNNKTIVVYRNKIYRIGDYNNGDTYYGIYRLENPKASLTFLAKNLLKDGRRFHSTHSAYWSISEIRAWCNGEFYNSLPEDLQTSISEVIKVSDTGFAGQSLEDVWDKIWICSLEELGCDHEYNIPGQGSPYSIFTDNNSRKRYRSDGTNLNYLTRSARIYNRDTAHIIYGSYGRSDYALFTNANQGVLPGFCI